MRSVQRHQRQLRGSHRQVRHPVKPGTVTAAGKRSANIPSGTLRSVLKLIQEAIEFHIEGLREIGDPVPSPVSVAEVIEVTAAPV